MAPRARTSKRLSRMDAAVDAMSPFGFGARLVQKTLKQLLKEYGGDDGWAFIEEYGYKELIDAILRDQESNHHDTTKNRKGRMGVSSQDERADDPALQSSIGPSGTLVDSTNDAGNALGETSGSELGTAAGEPTNEELCSNKQDIGSTELSCPLLAEGDGNKWTDIGEDQTSTQKERVNSVCSDGENFENQVQPGTKSYTFASPPTSSPCPGNPLKMYSGSRVQSGSNPQVSAPSAASSLCPVNHLPLPADHHLTTLPSTKPVSLQPPRRRFPCYGWIESDEEDDEFIQLAPMKTTIIA